MEALDSTDIILTDKGTKPPFSQLVRADEIIFPNITFKKYYDERMSIRRRYKSTPMLDRLKAGFEKKCKI